MEFVEAVKAYRDLGYLGLWLLTLYVFYKHLIASKKEGIAITIQTVMALDKSTSAISDSTVTCKELKSEVNELKVGNEKFVEFLRGRDDGRRDK